MQPSGFVGKNSSDTEFDMSPSSFFSIDLKKVPNFSQVRDLLEAEALRRFPDD